MNKAIRDLVLLAAVVLIGGCGVTPSNYLTGKPEFKFDSFFDGRLCAWGLLRDRSGEVTRKFIAEIDAYQKDGKVVLDEIFQFSDGERQKRVWRFTKDSEGWLGRAGDVVGSARGKVWGDSLHLEYTLAITTEDSVWEVSMDDWLHLIDKNTLLGTTEMSKLGIGLGRIDITIRKQSSGLECGIDS